MQQFDQTQLLTRKDNFVSREDNLRRIKCFESRAHAFRRKYTTETPPQKCHETAVATLRECIGISRVFLVREFSTKPTKMPTSIARGENIMKIETKLYKREK